jgi:two-component system, NarL family, response regulator YdfI
VAHRKASLLRLNAVLRAAVVAEAPLVRAGLRASLEQAGGFEVVAAAASLHDLHATGPAALDVIVAESQESAEDAFGGHGAEGMPPLVLLLEADDGSPAEWLTDGITLLPKDASGSHIAAAAVAAASGLVATSKALMAEALRYARTPASSAASMHERLTAREAQVLEGLAQGLGNKAIAESLHISTHTAKFHVAQIIAKLDATSRAHAVAKALRAGLLEA